MKSNRKTTRSNQIQSDRHVLIGEVVDSCYAVRQRTGRVRILYSRIKVPATKFPPQADIKLMDHECIHARIKFPQYTPIETSGNRSRERKKG